MSGLLGSLGERLLELLIGRVKGSGKPTKAQEAAYAIYLPLSKVAGAPSHNDQRSIDEILEELVRPAPRARRAGTAQHPVVPAAAQLTETASDS